MEGHIASLARRPVEGRAAVRRRSPIPVRIDEYLLSDVCDAREAEIGRRLPQGAANVDRMIADDSLSSAHLFLAGLSI